MNDILNHLDRRSYEFLAWLDFEKSRVPRPEHIRDVEVYACKVWTYDHLISKIRRFPNQRIGYMLEKFISSTDDLACNGTERNVNRFSVIKDEAEWIEDQIISGGGWI